MARNVEQKLFNEDRENLWGKKSNRKAKDSVNFVKISTS